MKQILLLSAAYLNGGAYVDAGAAPEIGDDKHQITEERAVDIEKGLRGEIFEVEDAADAEDDGDGLEALTVARLKELAAEEGADVSSATNKPSILAAIRAHRG